MHQQTKGIGREGQRSGSSWQFGLGFLMIYWDLEEQRWKKGRLNFHALGISVQVHRVAFLSSSCQSKICFCNLEWQASLDNLTCIFYFGYLFSYFRTLGSSMAGETVIRRPRWILTLFWKRLLLRGHSRKEDITLKLQERLCAPRSPCWRLLRDGPEWETIKIYLAAFYVDTTFVPDILTPSKSAITFRLMKLN